MRRPQPLSAAAPAVQLSSPGLLGWARPDLGCSTLERERARATQASVSGCGATESLRVCAHWTPRPAELLPNYTPPLPLPPNPHPAPDPDQAGGAHPQLHDDRVRAASRGGRPARLPLGHRHLPRRVGAAGKDPLEPPDPSSSPNPSTCLVESELQVKPCVGVRVSGQG